MKQKILVLGASGLVGRYLYKFLKQEHIPLVGTYNRNPARGLLHFDLTKSSLDELPLEEVSHAVICSAIAKLDKCKEEKEYSDSVNLIGTKRVLTELSQRKIASVFISSAAVFDGILGNYKEDRERNPTTVYGMQKKDIEDFIFKSVPECLVLRPGKIFGADIGEGVLFADWLAKYRSGEEIFCADDEKLSPTYAEDIAKGIVRLIEQEAAGVYHINPMEHYSRFEMAVRFFDYLSIKDAKLRRCSIDDFPFLEKRPKNTYLDASKFINQTGFKFKRLEECFEMIK